MNMYVVHVRRTTATDARRGFFRLLDEVLAGETVVIERKGRSIVLRAENIRSKQSVRPAEYRRVLGKQGMGWIKEIEGWTWGWEGPGKPLRLTERKGR